jgi:hypothetical protein
MLSTAAVPAVKWRMLMYSVAVAMSPDQNIAATAVRDLYTLALPHKMADADVTK